MTPGANVGVGAVGGVGAPVGGSMPEFFGRNCGRSSFQLQVFLNKNTPQLSTIFDKDVRMFGFDALTS